MGNVKSAFEKAMEKIESIEALTPEEKEQIEDREKIRSVLAAFYRGELGKDDLWEKLKGAKSSLLAEVQRNMADSLRLGILQEEFQRRREGILAIESLKEKRNAAAVENMLNMLEKMRKEFKQIKEQAADEMRAAVEQNPQMRMRPVRTADGRTVLQPALSIDEAVQERLAQFLDDNEKRYGEMFASGAERLKREMA
ncbi:MAG: hypothetical protein P8Z71_06595 [Candidatus Sulfobium sp.]|jgi:hypothetical protein